MITVVLDTNVLYPLLRHPRSPWQVLLGLCRERAVRLLIPDVVWMELENLDTERLIDAHRRWQQASRAVGELGVRPPPWPRGEEECRAASVQAVATFRESFEGAGGRVAAMPDTPHGQVVRRALDRRRPFDEHGRDGYRDALLWESVMELVEAGSRVLLVSNDRRAFAGTGKRSAELHPSLVEEAKERRGPGGAVRLARSIGAAAEDVSERAAATKAMLGKLITDDLAADLLQLIAEKLFDHELSHVEIRRAGWPSAVVAARIDDVSDLHAITVLSALPLDEQRVAAEVGAGFRTGMTLILEADLPDADYRFLTAEQIGDGGRTLLEPYDRVEIVRDLYAYADVIIEPETGALSRCEITLVDLPQLYAAVTADQTKLDLG